MLTSSWSKEEPIFLDVLVPQSVEMPHVDVSRCRRRWAGGTVLQRLDTEVRLLRKCRYPEPISGRGLP